MQELKTEATIDIKLIGITVSMVMTFTEDVKVVELRVWQGRV